MKIILPALVMVFISMPVHAGEWVFSDPVVLAGQPGKRVFHHLEPSGRRSLAVADDTVAVTWEDDRDGTPRVYLSRSKAGSPDFAKPIQLSGAGEAYDPVISAIPGGRFLVAWEEDSQVYARRVDQHEAGPVLKLSSSTAAQPVLASQGKSVVAAWSERAGQHGQIELAELDISGSKLSVRKRCRADAEEAKDEQLYPALAAVDEDLLIAWEDRRPGHTIIMAAHGRPCELSAPVRVSETIEQRSAVYGKGHGVSRVALAEHGKKRVLAVWADKRDFREGYDIYAADYEAGKGFGSNMLVQDDFGGVARQWHPTAAGHENGVLLVAWTDEREGNSDIVYSVYADGEWSEDIPMPGASGPGEQAHPSILIDAAGRLHVAWIERDERNGPTRLKYMTATAGK
jgi:hypothetical protein